MIGYQDMKLDTKMIEKLEKVSQEKEKFVWLSEVRRGNFLQIFFLVPFSNSLFKENN